MFDRLKIPDILFLIVVYLPLVCSIQLSDLFHVKSGVNGGGLDSHVDTVQSWLDDTATLVDFLLAQMAEEGDQVDSTDTALRRNLKSWFNLRLRRTGGIHPDDDEEYKLLRERLSNIDKFFKKNLALFKVNNMPWIFYNSDWQEKTELLFDDSGNGIDEDGNIMVNNISPSNKPQANMRTWTRPQNFVTVDKDRDNMLTDMKGGSGPDNWDIYAYWSTDIRDYGISSRNDEANVGKGGFCDRTDGQDMFALTIGNMLLDSITLCPDAFTNKAESHETIAEGIASEEATSNKLGIALESTSPRSLTLFHELVHLTSDTSKTTDVGTKPTECLALITAKRESEARTNPDNIVFFAWSYYLEQKGNPSFRWHNGKKVRQS